MVYLHRSPDDPGPYAFNRGPSYGIRAIGDKTRTHTSISPIIAVMRNVKDLNDRSDEADGVTPDDLLRNVLLTETAETLDVDIVVSDAITVGRRDIPSNYRANVVRPEQSIPIIAHYLRTQQVYRFDPHFNMTGTRRAFYQESAFAMAPRIWHWLGACEQTLDRSYRREALEMIGRLSRAFKAFDDLLFYMGSYPSNDNYDDVGESIDRLLVSLCGAVDVMARSLSRALQLPDGTKNVRMHEKRWFKKNLRPIFENSAGWVQLAAAQQSLETVFRLRNTIHSISLQAAGAGEEPAAYVEKNRGRMNLMVPSEIYDSLHHDEQAAWGLSKTLGYHITADLATVAQTAMTRVLRFLDRLCWVASYEKVPDCEDFMNLDVQGAISSLGPGSILYFPRLLGLQSAAHDDEVNAPYPVHPAVGEMYEYRREQSMHFGA